MSAARADAWPMRAISSFVVTPGIRAVIVAAWCLKSRGRSPSGALVVVTAARQAAETAARRAGRPVGPGPCERGAGLSLSGAAHGRTSSGARPKLMVVIVATDVDAVADLEAAQS